MMLENLSSLLESLVAVKKTGKEQDLVRPLDELIPSLRKIRKLAGMFLPLD